MTALTGNCLALGLTIIALMSYPASLHAALSDELREILIQSIGGPSVLDSLKELTGYVARGTASVNGMEGTFVQYYRPPDQVYQKVSLHDLELVQAYDGNVAWKQDFNGQISKLAGQERRELLKTLYMDSHAYLFDDRMPGGAELLSDTTINGTVLRRVAFYPLLSDTVVALYNNQTYRRRIVISRLDDVRTITFEDDYRLVGGIMFPFHTRAEATGAPMDAELRLKSLELNLPFDSSIFYMPTSTVVDYEFPAGKNSVCIPFAYRGGHVLVNGVINGKMRVWFILDSGASANILHSPTADALGLKSVGQFAGKGIGGFDKLQLVSTDSIAIGELVLYDQIAGKIDMSRFDYGGPADRLFAGLLGYDFLSRFPIRIDYDNELLTVFDPNTFSAPPGGMAIDFSLTMQVPTVLASIEGIVGDFIVDLGNPYGLLIHKEYYTSAGLDSLLLDIGPLEQSAGGIGGGYQSRKATANNVYIGSYRLGSLSALLTESTAGVAASTELAGNIGNAVLQRFGALFDYRGSRLILYPTDTIQEQIVDSATGAYNRK
ncbi:MAG: aspartyl protease family protein [Candidatus Zixiibacteriota bacterium]